jgi:hypothetical protein
MSTVSLPSVLLGAFAWAGSRVEPFCELSRISAPPAAEPTVVDFERLRRRRAERLVPVPCPPSASGEPEPSPRPDEPLALPDAAAFCASALPLPPADDRPPEDLELDEPLR